MINKMLTFTGTVFGAVFWWIRLFVGMGFGTLVGMAVCVILPVVMVFSIGMILGLFSLLLNL